MSVLGHTSMEHNHVLVTNTFLRCALSYSDTFHFHVYDPSIIDDVSTLVQLPCLCLSLTVVCAPSLLMPPNHTVRPQQCGLPLLHPLLLPSILPTSAPYYLFLSLPIHVCSLLSVASSF